MLAGSNRSPCGENRQRRSRLRLPRGAGAPRRHQAVQFLARHPSPPEHSDARGGERNRTAVQGFAVPCLNHSATPPELVTVLSAAAPPGAKATLADARRTVVGRILGVGVRELRTPEPPCPKTDDQQVRVRFWW